jgi:2-dehydropantoate 2-reductase
VTHFVRQGKQERFKDGIHLDIIDDRKGHQKNTVTKYDLKCVETVTPPDRYELIILPVHFYQVEAALQALVPVSANTLFLDFGSNWNGTEMIDKYLSREQYLLGFPYGGGLIQNGEYLTWLGTKVYLGEVDGNKHTEKIERVKSLFAQADIYTNLTDNILHLIWTSHAGAVALSAGVAKSKGALSFVHDRALMVHCHSAVRELHELCRLRGVNPHNYPDQALLFKIPPWLFIPTFRLFCTYSVGVQRAMDHLIKPAKDTGAIYEVMQKTAQELNFDMPYMKVIEEYLQIR